MNYKGTNLESKDTRSRKSQFSYLFSQCSASCQSRCTSSFVSSKFSTLNQPTSGIVQPKNTEEKMKFHNENSKWGKAQPIQTKKFLEAVVVLMKMKQIYIQPE